jgi:hypothetical protein
MDTDRFNYIESIVVKYSEVLEKYAYLLVYGAPEALLPIHKNELKPILIEYILLLAESGKLNYKTFRAVKLGYAYLAAFLSNKEEAQRAIEYEATLRVGDVEQIALCVSTGKAKEVIERMKIITKEMEKLFAEFDDIIKN